MKYSKLCSYVEKFLYDEKIYQVSEWPVDAIGILHDKYYCTNNKPRFIMFIRRKPLEP